VGVPPDAFTSAPSRAIDNAVSIPIGRVASVGPRRNAKKRLPPHLSALRALSTIATLRHDENTSCVMGCWRLLARILRVRERVPGLRWRN